MKPEPKEEKLRWTTMGCCLCGGLEKSREECECNCHSPEPKEEKECEHKKALSIACIDYPFDYTCRVCNPSEPKSIEWEKEFWSKWDFMTRKVNKPILMEFPHDPGKVRDFIQSKLSLTRKETLEECKKEPSCPPHNLIPYQYQGAWSASVPPPNMKCTKCLLETRF